jgi:hypothetical protein
MSGHACGHHDCTPPTVYAVYHRTCGHVAAAPNVRVMAAAFVAAMSSKGQHQWRIRVATDDDLLALLSGARCLYCTQDSEVTA